MTAGLLTRWKLLVDLTDQAVGSLSRFFNLETGNGFIRTLGGRSVRGFNPTTLSCKSQFYDALRSTIDELGFKGRKFPLTTDGNSGINFRFRLYGASLLIIEIELATQTPSYETTLLDQASFWNQPAIALLAMHIVGAIENGSRRIGPSKSRPKVIHCARIVADPQHLPSDSQLVELLTRHRSASDLVIKSVISRNKQLQSDASTLLVDRQGVVAVVPSSAASDRTVMRRFDAACNMLEVAAATERMIEKGTLANLGPVSLSDLRTYFLQPDLRFAHSTSSLHIWCRFMAEFNLTHSRWTEIENEMNLDVQTPTLQRVLILTAIEEEAAPLIQRLTARSAVKAHGVYATRGSFSAGNSPTIEVYVCIVGIGNTKAALNTQAVIGAFVPDLVIFSGIAGGRKEATIGSVVVASLVYYYESGKEVEGGFLPRPRLVTLSPQSDSLANTFLATERESDKAFEVYFKPIACGEKLLSTSGGPSATAIKEIYGDCLAVEMEGFGYLSAMGRGTGPAILIRGISDMLDNKSQNEDHELAIRNATEITFRLIGFYASIQPVSNQR